MLKTQIIKNCNENWVFIPLPTGTNLNPLLKIHEEMNIVYADKRIREEDNKNNWEAVLSPIPGTNPLQHEQWVKEMPEDAIGVAIKCA